MNKAQWGVVAGVLLLLIIAFQQPVFQGAAVYSESIHEELNTTQNVIPLQFSGIPTSLKIDADLSPGSIIKLVDDDSELIVTSSSNVVCEETCLMSTISKNATLLVEGSAKIKSIDYSVEIENSAPIYTSEKTSFKIAKDGTLELNLNSFFEDPDDDTLTFLSTGNDFIETVVDGSTLTISPDTGYTGTSTISLLALDDRHSVSQEVKIVVSPGLSGMDEVIENSPAVIDEDIIPEVELLDEVEVIVKLKESKDKSAAKKKDRKIELDEKKANIKQAKEQLLAGFTSSDFSTAGTDGQIQQTYENVDAIAIKVTQQGLQKLAQDPNVESIHANSPFSTSVQDSVPLINASLVHTSNVSDTYITGAGYSVCIVDTGVDQDHPDLHHIIPGYDYINNDADPEDDNGHGTHVAGIVHNTAPGANLIITKVCDNNGDCTAASILGGIDYCINNSINYNISVISASLGDKQAYTSDSCPTFFDSSLQTASNLGIANVFASGNEGFTNGISYPACSPYAISVGSTTKDDQLSSFTNTGDLLDVLAPGSNINSTYLAGSHASMSGTSMATPFVSGSLSLIQQYQNLTGGNYTPSSALQALKVTGITVNSWPRIDVYAALDTLSEGNISGTSGGTNSDEYSTLAIPTCGDTISTDYTMTGDIVNSTGGNVCPADSGLLFGSDDITLDCAGYTIRGNGTNLGGSAIGIDLKGHNGTRIINCNISNFDGRSIDADNVHNLVVTNSMLYNASRGFESYYGNNITLKDNIYRYNFRAVQFVGTNDSIITNGTFIANVEGLFVSSSFNITIANNLIANSTSGGFNGGITSSSNYGNIIFINNTLIGNAAHGIRFASGGEFSDLIANNSFIDNNISGISAEGVTAATFIDNYFKNNTVGLSLNSLSENNVVKNNIFINSSTAIQLKSSQLSSFIVQVYDGGWVTKDVVHYSMLPETQQVYVGDVISTGDYKVRLIHVGDLGAAHIDSVFLESDTLLAPDLAMNMNDSEDITSFVNADDFDVADVLNDTVILTWNSVAHGEYIHIKAREEPLGVSKNPLFHPAGARVEDIGLEYTLDGSTTPIIDGDITAEDGWGDADFIAYWEPASGHPAGDNIWYVTNDAENLYVGFEFTSDNTIDDGKDWARVHVVGGSDFVINTTDTSYGRSQLTYTDSVVYRHMVYEFSIPLNEIGATQGDNIELAFSGYGTGASGPTDNNTFVNNTIKDCAVAFNISTADNITIFGHTLENNDLDLAVQTSALVKIINTSLKNYSLNSAIIEFESDLGNLKYLSAISADGSNFSADFILAQNSLAVNSSNVPGLSQPANITFYNTGLTTPQILRNGSNCPADVCTELFNDGSTFIFNVTGFSTYSITASDPSISSIILNTTDAQNTTLENLTLQLTVSDPSGTGIKNITNWFVNGTSQQVILMPFEPGTSKTIFANDYSPLDNDGVVDGATFDSSIGYDGHGAFIFDGINDKINISDSPSTNFSLANNFTITLWFNTSVRSLDGIRLRRIISKEIVTDEGPPELQQGYTLAVDNTGGNINFAIKNGSLISVVSSVVGLDDGQWHFLAAVKNGSQMRIYSDGTLDNTASITLDGEIRVPRGLRIGVFNDTEGHFNGHIDELEIWNRSLSPEQINLLFHNVTDVIVNQETKINNRWQAQVTPNDGTQDGVSVLSNNVTILEQLPELTLVTLNSDSGFGRFSDNLTVETTGINNDINISTFLVNDTSILLLNLPFDGGSNDTFTRDYSTYEHNATGYNMTYDNTAGITGGAYVYDGRNNSVLNASTSDLLNIRYPFTFETWVNVSGTIDGLATIIANKGNVWAMSMNKSPLGVIQVDIPGLTPQKVGNASSPINQNDYTHVGFTWDGSYVSIYRDGKQIHKQTVSGTPSTDDGFLAIGANAGLPQISSTLEWNGTIDNVRIWNRSLTEAQFEAIFQDENYSTSLKTIKNTETVIGDRWSVLTTPNDNTQDGTTVQSNEVPILGTAPTISNLIFNSSRNRNTTNENLTLHFTTTDPAGNGIRNVTTWFVNGSNTMILNLPFEGGSTPTQTHDYARGTTGTVYGANFSLDGGKVGGAYEFNGTEYIKFSNNPAFNNWNDSVSIDTWLLPRSFQPGNNHTYVYSKFTNGLESKHLTLNSTGHVRAVFFVGNVGLAAQDFNVTSPDPIPLNSWTHITTSYDGTNLRLFINGSLVASTGPHSGTIQDNVGDLYIGWDPSWELLSPPITSYAKGFNGTIDQFRIWDYNLTEDQARLIYLAENASRNYLKIDSSMTSIGQNWSANITVSDGQQDAIVAQTDNITILAPITKSLFLNATTVNNLSTDNLTAYTYDIPGLDTTGANLIYNWHEHSTNDPIEIAILPFDVEVSSEIPGSIRNYAFDGIGNGSLDNGTATTPVDSAPPSYVRHSGIRGGGYQFNGNNTVINMGHDKLYALTDSFSIEVWMNASYTAQDSTQRFIDRAPGGIGAAANYRCYLGAAAQPMKLTCYIANGISVSSVDSGSFNVPSNRISHVVFTYDKNINKLRLYVNGTSVGEATATVTPKDSTGAGGDISRLTIGAGDGSGGPGGGGININDPFNGTIDHMVIYNRSLSTSQVQALWNSGQRGRNITVSSMTSSGQNWSVNVTPITQTAVGQINSSDTITILQGDFEVPEVTNLTPAQKEFGIFSDITLTANVTDNTLVSDVYANLTYPSGSIESFRMTPDGDIYSVLLPAAERIGIYNFSIFAIDNDGNINNSVYTTFNVTSGNLSCIVEAGLTCSGDATNIFHLSDITNAHAELANQSDYGYSVCCRDIAGENEIYNSSGTTILKLSNVTNAHIELPGESNYNEPVRIGASRDNLVCDSYQDAYGTCGNENQTCVVTVSETESSSQSNLHGAQCSTGNYSTSICCGFIGNLYIPPIENTTQRAFIANASFSGPLSNSTRSFSAQSIEYQNDTLGRRVEFLGLFNESDVNASLLIIEADDNRTWTNATRLVGVTQAHTLYIPNSNNGTGVYICPDARNLSEVRRGCDNEISIGVTEFNSFSDGINVTLTNGEYMILNLTNTGVGPLGEESFLKIYDDTDVDRGSKVKLIDDDVYFFANYTNSTNGVEIPSAVCNITSVDSDALEKNSMTFNDSSLLYEFNMSFPSAGTFDWNVTCHNLTAGYPVVLASDTVIIISDITPPEVQNLTPQGIFDQTEGIILRANVTDDQFLGVVLVNVTRPDGQTDTYSMTNTSDIFNVTYDNFANLPGSYSYRIIANDSVNNINDSVFSSFNVGALCGDTVLGDIKLAGDISQDGTCLSLPSDSELDCRGFSITGDHTGQGINMINNDNNSVINCVVRNFYNGIRSQNSSDALLRNNTVYNNTLRNILVINRSSFITIELSDLYATRNESSTNVLVSSWVENLTIRNNLIHNSSLALFLVDSSDIYIYNNTFQNNNITAFRTSINNTHIRLINNSFFDNRESISAQSDSENITIHNNEVRDAYFRSIVAFNHGSNISITNNRIYQSNTSAIIFADIESGIIKGNRIENVSSAIQLQPGVTDINITENIISNSTNAIFIIEAQSFISNNMILESSRSFYIRDTLNVTFSDSIFNPQTRIDNTSHGAILYTKPVLLLSSTTLSDVISFGNNTIFVNSTAAPGLNQSAKLIFYNVSHHQAKATVDFEDNGIFIECTNCTDQQLSGTTFSYNVSSFTTYNSTEGVLPVIDILLPSSDTLVDEQITMRANVTDNVAVDKVIVNVTSSAKSELIELTDWVAIPDYFGKVYTNTYDNGVYNFTFIANDSANNIQTASVVINVNPLPPPPDSPGGTRPLAPPVPAPIPAPVPAPIPAPIPVPSMPELSIQVPQSLQNIDLGMDIVCASYLSGAGTLVSESGNLGLFNIPEGFERVSGPFTLTCAGETIDLTLSVPHTFKDLVALRCNDYGCTRIGAFALGDDELVCSGESVDELRKSELLAQKDFLTPSDFTPVKPYKKDITLASPVIAVGKYRVEFVEESFEAGLSSPVSSVPQPRNPNTNIIGAPLVITGQGQAVVEMPYKTPQGYDEHTFGLYALDGTDWMYLDSSVDALSNTISASVDLDQFNEYGQTTIAVIGAGCDACDEVEFKRVYDGGSRRAVILIHGFMSNPLTWQFLLDDFQLNDQPHQIWTVGFPSTMTLEQIIDDLMKQIEVHSSEFDEVQIVGHSLGAFIAQELAYEASLDPDLTFDDKTKDMILVGAPHDGSKAAEDYGKLWSALINAKSTESIFNPSSPLTQDLREGRQIPKVEGIDYYAIAGTSPYKLEVGGVVISSDELFELSDTNDGVVTTTSAQHVGGSYINDLCDDYFEIDVPHTELINHPAARKIIERLLTKRIYDEGAKAVGYTQYLRLNIDECSANDNFMIIGRPISEAEASGLLDCKCGNGVCGVDESILSCPVDCSVMDDSSTNFRLLSLFLLALFLAILLGLIIRKIFKRSERYVLPKSARDPWFRLPGYKFSNLKPKIKSPKQRIPKFDHSQKPQQKQRLFSLPKIRLSEFFKSNRKHSVLHKPHISLPKAPSLNSMPKLPSIKLPKVADLPKFPSINLPKLNKPALSKYEKQRLKMKAERDKLAEKLNKKHSPLKLTPKVLHHGTPVVLKEGLFKRFLKKFKTKHSIDLELMQKRLDHINEELKK